MSSLGLNDLEETQGIGLLALFQIDLENYLKIKFAMMQHLPAIAGILEQMPYWEYEEHVEMLVDYLQKKKAAETGTSQQQQNYDPQREAGKFIKNVPKMNAPSMKMPNFKK